MAMSDKTNYHEIARKIVNQKVSGMLMGMTLDDLPDTCEVCDIVDSLGETLEAHGYTGGKPNEELKREVSSHLSDIDFDFLQDLIMG